MAEYYPLLARAIAGLPQSTPEARRAIYDRARMALIGQLRAVQPPIAEDDIQRESRMLDEAVERLEKEAAAAAAAPPSTPPAPSAPAGSTAVEARKPGDLASRRAETPLVRPTAQPARMTLPPRPSLPQRPGAPPAGERQSAAAASLEAARQRLASLARPSSARRDEASAAQQPSASTEPAPPARKEESSPASPPSPPSPPQPPKPKAVASEPPPIEPPKPGPTEAEIAASRLAADAGAERRDAPATMNITLRKYGPRAEAAGVSADFPALEPQDEPRTGGVRPAAPLPPEEKERNFRPLLIGLPIALVVGGIAIFAYMRRDNPEELARLRPAPGVEAPAEQSAGKIVERIGGGQAARPADAPAQPQAPASQQQAQQTAPLAPAIPVSQRAALLVDAPEEPQRVRTYVGNVVWRLDNVSRGPGQPLAIGVRAEIDLPDAKLKAVILLQKNTDATLPASHTIEVRFTPTEGGPIPGVAQISTPQMRKEDTPAGDALAGVPAPIMPNFFLVGLNRGDAQATRNIDLIRNRGWIDIPMLLSDQRIAKITFEKGSAGERVINEAFEAWK